MSAALTLLRSYAERDPLTLPKTVLKTYTAHTLTIYDAYPKSMFHLLVLPRIVPPHTEQELTNLRTLFQSGRDKTLEVLRWLEEDARTARDAIQEEMLEKYGFKWEVHTGFHPDPSMEHLHLHVISADYCSPALKIKKHYNSFHPKLGFFLHLHDVLEWFDDDVAPSYFQRKTALKISEYKEILKQDLECYNCEVVFRTMPRLKEHLQEEWDKLAKRAENAKKREEAKKRKREKEAASADPADGEVQTKKQATEEVVAASSSSSK